jgi:hypothetical protein
MTLTALTRTPEMTMPTTTEKVTTMRSKKELRDMILAAAKTALEMSKRSTRKVQHGNEAKRTKRTALQKEKEADEGWEQQIFCVSSLGFEITSAHDQATELCS